VELLALQGMPDRDDHPYWEALTKQRKDLAPPPPLQQVVVTLPTMAAASQQREVHHGHPPSDGAAAGLERPSSRVHRSRRSSLERHSGRTHRSRGSFDQPPQAHVHATVGGTKALQSRLASPDLGSRQAPAAAAGADARVRCMPPPAYLAGCEAMAKLHKSPMELGHVALCKVPVVLTGPLTAPFCICSPRV
jgi:hypothetical protein